jgi:hypothetical protein
VEDDGFSEGTGGCFLTEQMKTYYALSTDEELFIGVFIGF